MTLSVQRMKVYLDTENILTFWRVPTSSDEKAACKKLLEAVGLRGYQVLIMCTSSLETSMNTRLVYSALTFLFYLQIGKTKVLLMAGQMAELDARRTEVLGRAARIIQRKFRSYLLLKAAINIQAVCRGI